MERRVLIDHWQKVTQEDFNNFGVFPQQSIDHVVGDLGVRTKAYTGFDTVQSAAAEVTIGTGRLYINTGDGTEVHFNADQGGTAISMLGHLPVATKRVVTLTVWANEVDTETEPRTFLTDADTRATVARPTSTVRMRRAEISPVYGIEAPDPLPPAVAANVLAFCNVTLDTTGVAIIEMIEENRISSIETLGLSDREMSLWRNTIGARLDTLASDLSALAARLVGTAPMDFVRRLASDLAIAKSKLNLPEGYVAWHANSFADETKSDLTHVDYLARVEEGIRFPPASENNSQMALLNPVDPAIINQDNFVLPAYELVTRLSVKAPLGTVTFEQSISQFPYQTVAMKQMHRTRRRVRYGAWYWLGVEAAAQLVLAAYGGGSGGVIIPGTGVDGVSIVLQFSSGEVMELVYDSNLRMFRGRYVWIDHIDDPYWVRTITTRNISGSSIGESFLNSQDGWLIGVNLRFTRKGATGDVHVSICETTEAGTPDLDRTVAYATLAPSAIKVDGSFTTVQFIPTFLTKAQNAKRYCIVLHTAGNHFVRLVEGYKFGQGTLFYSTDQAYYAGELTKDLEFELLFARFASTRTEVQLAPLTLSGGIANIDLLLEAITPNGTNIVFEVQISGVWRSIQDPKIDPPITNGLPPLLPLRAVLVGTTESMPGIGVGANSRALTSRPRSDYKHISTAINLATPSNKIEVEFVLDRWRGAPFHTMTARLMTGAGYTTLTAPSVIADEAAPEDPTNRLIRTCTWNLGAPVSTFKLRTEGTTDNVLATYSVIRRRDVEL